MFRDPHRVSRRRAYLIMALEPSVLWVAYVYLLIFAAGFVAYLAGWIAAR